MAYYDAARQMAVATRMLGAHCWDRVKLPITLGWDSHNHLALGVDTHGHVHLCGRMHADPLVYFRTRDPLDIRTFERIPAMVEEHEERMTYPRFVRAASGDLVFAYRSGTSGKGDLWFNCYDVDRARWRRLAPTPVIDGEGKRSAYPVGPVLGPDQRWHLVWVWRDTPDAATNHDLSYARSHDLVRWENGAGVHLASPIRFGTGEIVDPVAAHGGMINSNTRLGFDSLRRPTIAYHKYDELGHTQLYNARLEDERWVTQPASDWQHRWEFGGGGTLVFEIEVDGIQPLSRGTLMQRWYHAKLGGWGAFLLDEETLRRIDEIPAPLVLLDTLADARGEDPRLVVHMKEEPPSSSDVDRYLLRWETLEANRDAALDNVPSPTDLDVCRIRGGIPPSPWG